MKCKDESLCGKSSFVGQCQCQCVCLCVCVCVCVYVCVFYACMHVGLCAGGDAIMFECLSCIV